MIMARDLFLYDTLKREKRIFKPVNPGYVGMYVCGPTVYGDPHLGHARPAITFDLLFRLFRHLGHKVRYVSNITDVGHLENDADTGEDKIAKKARLESLEPMEVVQTYTLRYHEAMKQLNVLRPSIEPRASGHIIEQIELVKTILDAGYAYISNGSVYFDVEKYDRVHTYGVLSGRIIDDMMAGSRELDGQDDKRSPNDFALWKKASPEHIMRWPSPWSVGFPGWHLECSAMSEKYLGEEFDIHGGGMDLIFPHHECELAQNVASRGKGGVNYWVHNNLITINGQKMGKSKGNFITLEELFAGRHEALDQPYSPMTIRFFILQAHYRSTLDFSNEALQAAEKGLKRLMQAAKDVVSLKHSADAPTLKQVASIKEEIYQALLDDINTPVALSSLFEAVKIVNGAKDKGEVLNDADYNTLNRLFMEIVSDVLGLTDDRQDASAELLIGGLVDMILQTRNAAKAARNWAESDRIRDELKAIGIQIKDTKEGTEWELTN
jgi:cysteinyl-tRNA synthetase